MDGIHNFNENCYWNSVGQKPYGSFALMMSTENGTVAEEVVGSREWFVGFFNGRQKHVCLMTGVVQ